MANKMKVSMKGANSNLPGASSMRASYGGNMSSRPGTSHRVMGHNNYNTISGGSKYKNSVNKATTSLGHVTGSPNRMNNKRKHLMD